MKTEAITKRLISTEEYHQMGEVGILKPGDRLELINGEILLLGPIGSRHAAVVDRLAQLFQRAINDRALIRVQNPVILNDLSEPEPDLSILKMKHDFYASGHPRAEDVLVVAEISDSTLAFDQNVKKELYASSGISQYLLINLVENQIEVYSDPKDGYYGNQQIRKGDESFDILGSGFVVSDAML